jgi:hypothetical protein
LAGIEIPERYVKINKILNEKKSENQNKKFSKIKKLKNRLFLPFLSAEFHSIDKNTQICLNCRFKTIMDSNFCQ